jgi:GxxExxY protein
MKDMKSVKGVRRSSLAENVIGCAIEVHRELGPGLLESAYEQCLARELALCSVTFERQVPLPVKYKGALLDCGYRMDFVVGKEILLELKSVECLLPIHEAQLLSYLKLSNLPQGFLINFNVRRLIDGLKSFLF